MVAVYYLIQTASDLFANLLSLTERETSFLSGLRYPKRRQDWLLGRWTAKLALASYYFGSNADLFSAFGRIEILNNPKGAPEASLDGMLVPESISISHRNQTSVCMISEKGSSLGADLELIEPRSENFVKDFFTESEIDFVKNSSTAAEQESICLIWSAKESALKALQLGLKADTRSVEISFIDQQSYNGWRRFVAIEKGSGRIFNGWWIRNDNLLLTMAACPEPDTPILITIETKKFP